MFVLTKDWQDFAPDLDMVQIHFTWTPHGEQPDWDRLEETQTLRVVPDTAPTYRVCGLELPRQVNGAERYDLHHFFVYVQGGREQVSPLYTEEIVSRTITYEDWQGAHTLVGLRWAVGAWRFVNYTLLALAGLDLTIPAYQNTYTPEQAVAWGLEFPYIYEFVNSRPLPHVFGGKVHGPRGAVVQYDFHLCTLGGPLPEQDREVWETNQGRHWQIVLP